MGLSKKQLKESIKNQIEQLVNSAFENIKPENSVAEIADSLLDISDYLPKANYIQHIFEKKYGEELRKVVWQKVVLENCKNEREDYINYLKEQGYSKFFCCCDEPYLEDSYNRGEEVNLIEILGDMVGDLERKIVCLTNRKTKDVIEITAEQYCRDLIEWIVENKKSGFYFDW